MRKIVNVYNLFAKITKYVDNVFSQIHEFRAVSKLVCEALPSLEVAAPYPLCCSLW